MASARQGHMIYLHQKTMGKNFSYIYHLESRWRNSHVLVYHGPLLIHLLGLSHLLSLRCTTARKFRLESWSPNSWKMPMFSSFWGHWHLDGEHLLPAHRGFPFENWKIRISWEYLWISQYISLLRQLLAHAYSPLITFLKPYDHHKYCWILL